MVAQELSLAPHLSVLDNIWLGQRDVPLFHRRAKFRAACRRGSAILVRSTTETDPSARSRWANARSSKLPD